MFRRQRSQQQHMSTLAKHATTVEQILTAIGARVGMLTKNASRSNGYLYGLYVQKIYQSVELYLQEKQTIAGNTSYCTACGILSRAPSFGGYYCENCGNTLSYAIDMTRFPQPNLVSLYGENAHRACPNCSAQVGFYKGECLRCGHEL